MRKAARLIELEDILSSSFFGEDDPLIGPILKTHLAIEACLVEMIQITRPDDTCWGWKFLKKTKWLRSQGVITQSDKEALDLYNDLRNDFAHIFGHSIDLKQLLIMAKNLENFGIEFSDSIGNYSQKKAVEDYDGSQGVVAEISWCILSHVTILMRENGGRDIFSS
ncbi:MAG: hypothetical protein OXI17_00970 [Gammaproteobacteria bacterium]|nr:hypothetical protein [Gammaproteobacteria bacterium]